MLIGSSKPLYTGENTGFISKLKNGIKVIAK